jgi:hypothetical protein
MGTYLKNCRFIYDPFICSSDGHCYFTPNLILVKVSDRITCCLDSYPSLTFRYFFMDVPDSKKSKEQRWYSLSAAIQREIIAIQRYKCFLDRKRGGPAHH